MVGWVEDQVAWVVGRGPREALAIRVAWHSGAADQSEDSLGVGAEAAEEELPVDDRRSVSVFVPVSPSVSISGVRGSESTDGVGSDECSSEGRDTSDAYE